MPKMTRLVVTVDGHTEEVIDEVKIKVQNALNIVGTIIEQRAAALTPTGKLYGGTLKQNWNHVVDGDTLSVGNNVHYAPYVELGTGPKYAPPPEWIEFQAEQGRGLSKWVYFDDKIGEFRTAFPQEGKHMLQHAIEDHLDEYKSTLEKLLNE